MDKELIDNSAAQIRGRLTAAPRVGVVLGSGLGAFAAALADGVRIPYADIDGMPGTGVPGHEGHLVCGTLGSVPVAVLQGRCHLYEGHSAADVVFGVRLLHELGARTLILTNASGGIADRLHTGALMLIEDHINLTGRNPLSEPGAEQFGERFVDMTGAYDPALRVVAMGAAERVGIELHEGVYAGLHGPSYETPAEIRMLRAMGADAVGMSTVLETIAARQHGARVLGLSCVANPAAGLGSAALDHEDVKRAAQEVATDLTQLLRAVITEAD